jgi:hypothetical protein
MTRANCGKKAVSGLFRSVLQPQASCTIVPLLPVISLTAPHSASSCRTSFNRLLNQPTM